MVDNDWITKSKLKKLREDSEQINKVYLDVSWVA